jgi:hypothetical protein
MVGLGETDEEILDVMRDLRAHDVEMLTIGQYLAPSGHHLPVSRYVHPDTFKMFEEEAKKMGFSGAAQLLGRQAGAQVRAYGFELLGRPAGAQRRRGHRRPAPNTGQRRHRNSRARRGHMRR